MKLTEWSLTGVMCAALLLSAPAVAKDGVSVAMPDNRVMVISEGDLEPASIGSYSISVFRDETLADFVAGAVFPRDGSVFMDNGHPRVAFADVIGDGHKDIIVTMLTAGSGDYLQVDVLRVEDKRVVRLVSVQARSGDDINRKVKEACKRDACAGL